MAILKVARRAVSTAAASWSNPEMSSPGWLPSVHLQQRQAEKHLDKSSTQKEAGGKLPADGQIH